MEAAFEEAFRFRKLKLDTIYLFSDGLPNIGTGVPASIANPTEEQRNHFMAKFVRDKLKTDWNRPQPGMSDVRINAVGFFFESPDVGAFLWAWHVNIAARSSACGSMLPMPLLNQRARICCKQVKFSVSHCGTSGERNHTV